MSVTLFYNQNLNGNLGVRIMQSNKYHDVYTICITTFTG